MCTSVTCYTLFIKFIYATRYNVMGFVSVSNSQRSKVCVSYACRPQNQATISSLEK
jgi:hypothetical protein